MIASNPAFFSFFTSFSAFAFTLNTPHWTLYAPSCFFTITSNPAFLIFRNRFFRVGLDGEGAGLYGILSAPGFLPDDIPRLLAVVLAFPVPALIHSPFSCPAAVRMACVVPFPVSGIDVRVLDINVGHDIAGLQRTVPDQLSHRLVPDPDQVACLCDGRLRAGAP